MWSRETTIFTVKIAGIRELKARLSMYLREVQAGEVILVTDRGRVVAEVRPPDSKERAASPSDLRLRQMVENGSVRPATPAQRGVRLWANWKGLGLPKGTAQRLLDAERAE
jgi:prevent-host-death family protein